MKITQITDLHIGKKEENTAEVDVRHNFLMTLGEVKIFEPDYLIITGDLCYDKGDISIYKWIKEKLDNVNIPYFIIPGNHDDRSMMREVFKIDYTQNEDEIFYAKKLKKYTALFLDSASGKMSMVQYNWIKRQLKQASKNLLIFTHYPPCSIGAKFMEAKYGFKNSKKLMDILSEVDKSISIFCGHFHLERTLIKNNINIYASPSLIYQIDPIDEEFKIEHYNIGFRMIEMSKNKLVSYVKYLEGSLLKK